MIRKNSDGSLSESGLKRDYDYGTESEQEPLQFTTIDVHRRQ